MSRPNTSLSIRLKNAGLIINNALSSREVLAELAGYNFKEEKIMTLKQQYDEVIRLNELQKKEYGEQYAATEELETIKGSAEESYRKSLKIARLVFKNNPAATGALLLDGERKKSASGFIEQARTFYNNLLSNGEFISAMSNYNCTQDKLLAERERIYHVETAFEKQQKERGEAKQATMDRDLKLDTFEQKVSELSAICKIAFEDRKDLLTALGV